MLRYWDSAAALRSLSSRRISFFQSERLEEAGGKHSLYVDKDDDKAMAEAIKQAMLPERRAKMIDEGYKWAQKFTMQQMAQETIECYKKVIAGRAQGK